MTIDQQVAGHCQRDFEEGGAHLTPAFFHDGVDIDRTAGGARQTLATLDLKPDLRVALSRVWFLQTISKLAKLECSPEHWSKSPKQ